MNEQDYVYAIAHPHGYVKIGRSNDPERRLRDHQSSSPYKLRLIIRIPVTDSRNVEAELHESYADKEVRGEWFELGPSEYDELVDLMSLAAGGKEVGSIEDLEKHRRQVREAIFR